MKPSPRTESELQDLDPDLERRVRALIEACPYQIGITSAWRSREEQERLYRAYKAGRGNPANPPGMSKHEWVAKDGSPASGAADLDYPDGPLRAEAVTWVHRRAASFGLCFPIRREDWHCESNGKPYIPPSKELDVDEKTLRKIIKEEVAAVVDKRVALILRGDATHPDSLKAVRQDIRNLTGEGS